MFIKFLFFKKAHQVWRAKTYFLFLVGSGFPIREPM